MSEGLMIFLVVLACVIGVVEIVATHFVHKHYVEKHGIKIYGGGLISFFAIAGLIFSIVLFVQGSMVGIAILLVTLLAFGFVWYYNIKKIGVKDGVILSLIEIILCFGCLFEPVELIAFRKKDYEEFNGKNNMLTKQQFNEYYGVKDDNQKKK